MSFSKQQIDSIRGSGVRLGNFYRVDELLEITVAAMIEIPGKFPNSEAGQRLHFGRLLARVFKDIQDTPGEGEIMEVLVDGFAVQCSLRRDQHRNVRPHYRFEEPLF